MSWIRKHILFHGKRHRKDLDASAITAFLGWLAVEKSVSPSTQDQAFSALLFLYKVVLYLDLGVGVGSTVAELRAAYHLAWVASGEGSVYMRVEELRASFDLDRRGSGGPQLAVIRDPAAVPGSVKITGVLLTGAG